MAYAQVAPWGPERLEVLLAHLLVRVVNYTRGKDDVPLSVHDLLPDLCPKPDSFAGYSQAELQALLDEKERTTMPDDFWRNLPSE